MIRTIEIKGYRALRYVRVDLPEFLVLVGPNASGKSTFFDAIGLVSDILQFGLDKAVYGDARLDLPPRAVDSRDLAWLRRGGSFEIAVTAELPEDIRSRLGDTYRRVRYECAVDVSELRFSCESLWLLPQENGAVRNTPPRQQSLFPVDPEPPEYVALPPNRKTPRRWRKVVGKVADSGNDYFKSETSGWNNQFRLGPKKSALGNLPADAEKFPAATWFKALLMEGIHRLQLNAATMRLPARAGAPRGFLPDGSNLPWIVHELKTSDSSRFQAWTDHVRTALDDLVQIDTREREEDRARYMVLSYRNGLEAPSWLLSDGTLRLLALTLLAYAPRPPSLLLIEEPENGIHPRAIETVLQSLSSVYDTQIFCTTHSPLVLSLIETKNLLCFAMTDNGAVDIVRGTDHPRLREWRSALHLGDLFATGVLE